MNPSQMTNEDLNERITFCMEAQYENNGRDSDSHCWNGKEDTLTRMINYLGASMNSQQAKDFATGFYSVVDAVLKE